jgi:hypothetical protein
MARLIDGQFRTVWQANSSEKSPSLVRDLLCHFDSLTPQIGKRGLDVVTHQIELMTAHPVSGMDSKLSRRQSENKPASTRVHRRHAQDICEERPDLLSFR